MGWSVTGLLLTLDVIPAADPAAAELRAIFAQVMKAILRAQDPTGAFLESSATGLFAHAMLRGVRLGHLGNAGNSSNYGDVSAAEYVRSAERADAWLRANAVLKLEDGALGYNLTVDVCSINSTTAFDVSCCFLGLPEDISH
jgi:hypothetical protein